MSSKPERELRALLLLDEWSRREAAPGERGVDDQRGVRTVSNALSRVAERVEKKRLRLRVAGAALSVAAVVALGFLGWNLAFGDGSVADAGARPESAPRVASRAILEAGEGVVDDRGSLLRAGSELSLDGVLRTGPGEARIRFPSGAAVSAAGESRVSVVASDLREEALLLSSGRVDVEVPPRGPARTFRIETPDAKVVVHGTRFVVIVDEVKLGLATRVEVERGIVAVHRGEREVARLTAGQSWPPADRVDGGRELSGAGIDEAPSVEPSTPVAAQRVSRRRAERRSGDRRGPRRAKNGTLAAEKRLFAEAMARKQAGVLPGTLDRVERFLSSHPRSVLRQDARVEHMRLLERLGRHADARSSARAYLSSYPTGFARDEARDLLGRGP
jgi:hypothetical protein